MNVLLVGSGGREHALAWKLAQSPRLTRLYALPGNPGIGQLAELAGDIRMGEQTRIVDFCYEKQIDLVVIGPELPLAQGLADVLQKAGFNCFGPSHQAARIEASKVFAKHFMARHGIPTARYAVFNKVEQAEKHLAKVKYPVVIKASGLAAGKGVILPQTLEEGQQVLKSILEQGQFGEAGEQVVIEERLKGPEVSLMAFSDGRTVVPMLPAQDHKRLRDGDRGPNTGGMGAYAPAPVLTDILLNEAVQDILQPAVDGLRGEGTPFVGVLYAGLMLTATGLRTLEFNCRFGDPETQAVLPLLESDLLEIALACVQGRLEQVEVKWKPGAAACVVLAAGGYPDQPEKGKLITLGSLPDDLTCFQAGTRLEGDRLLTDGGRVCGLTGTAQDLESAVRLVYDHIDEVQFEGLQFRRDIARGALSGMTYAQAGVDISAGNRAVELMKAVVKSTYTPAVLAGIGSFGGLYDAKALKKMKAPVLVASTDGVGTKVKLAKETGRLKGVGVDLVNHCINDILVQGARPLFFLDYFATDRLDPQQTAEVVDGIAEACRAAGMALLGGETAEMPGVYAPGEFDLAGTIVGVVEKGQVLPRSAEMRAGDALVGLASSGPHTNGFSLLRKLFAGMPMDEPLPKLGTTLAQALLASHRSYLELLHPHLGLVKGLVHLTGGGFIENIPRILPDGLGAVIHTRSWQPPALWKLVQERGKISQAEMYRTFNMGIGMLAVVGREKLDEFCNAIPEATMLVGELEAGASIVRLVK